MTIADDVKKLVADVEALKATPAGSTDLTPVLTAVADVKLDTTAIKDELTVTPTA